ncbi:hypothetical protein CCGE525_37450 (plasmid) [Rhizobium jaguaris]|uniref:Uncharacterized protein n=1 Tax=Rhizobium jaguaris TaxID=1312183 RepID=A0A387G1L7_9HYPH|nr:hypothetical protein CCGE525_37450 [Rhizobium jaguaris]
MPIETYSVSGSCSSDDAERGVRTWTSPADVVRLLLMRRVSRHPFRERGSVAHIPLGRVKASSTVI